MAIGLLLIGLILARWWAGGPAPPAAALSEGPHRVLRVVDGDTIILDDNYRVRLIGVNAPESVKPDSPVEPFGREAADFTKQFLSRGTARITLDQERLDRFGRYLAYVWVADRLLNEELLRRPGPMGAEFPLQRINETALPQSTTSSTARQVGHLVAARAIAGRINRAIRQQMPPSRNTLGAWPAGQLVTPRRHW